MSGFGYYALYLLPLLALVAFYSRKRVVRERESYATLDESIESGLTEPPTLHPNFILSKCFGSGACVKACPEKAIGIINGKGTLINPAHCIGHGACEVACPVKAIKLVFGTENRGVDIPNVNPNFETNVEGIFIAGELGGMGLIRKAVAQGSRAMDYIAKRPKTGGLDVVIVGAGPAGIAATLAAKKLGLKFVTVEQEDSIGGTTYHYPRNKIVMTAPMDLPLIGKIKVREISKESLMELWQGVIAKTQIAVQYNERMEEIKKEGSGFVVRTSKASYNTGSVLLSIGRRGTPRKLGSPGEDQAKVVYRLIEAEQYRSKHVVVVGGGDSALEAALDVCAEPGTTVTLAYRGAAFNRVKIKNRKRLDEAVGDKRLTLALETQIANISADRITLRKGKEELEMPNDAVIVCAGGDLPTPLLKKLGVQVETHYGS
ncbi:MAG: NAD(P)-binding domain-containing protein [Burkholderiales bacterium]|nr:NAD(P)-binding domain-containing protein [Burkholderiales bacterium]